ncbi:MAG: HAD-IB family phosphatase [Cyanobacteria bacterium K_Offshore_0m_m2_072]|nr:HAD-IB family phosphatase [Cyanobacteria bacterium K_Offshore_0m_m2_072]
MATARQTVPDPRGVAQAVIAAFDCDGTLIRADATRRFLLLLRGPVGLTLDLCRLAPQLLVWRLGRCSTAQLKEAVLNRALQVAPHRRREAALRQLPAILIAQLRPQAVARLRWHQQHGHRCLIVTASPEPLIAPLARHLGVELIATGCSDLLQVGPASPLRLTTPNCKGPEKLRRLEQHLGSLPPPKQLEAYGDSRGDRELLQASGHSHWRSFRSAAEPYPQPKPGRWIMPLSALALLLGALSGVLFTGPEAKADLVRYGTSLLQWLPVLYGVVALSNAGRYWRWRLLLGSLRIGRTSWPDLLGWFRGFALTATPAKLGELSRVQLLHEQLGYPRLPLVHVFVAERCADMAAVAMLLVVLTPAQVLGRLPSPTAPLLLGLVLVALPFAVFVSRPAPRHWLQTRWQHWRHHLPSGALARATVPASLISVLVWANEALVLWLLVQLLAPAPITIPAAIAIYLLSGTAGMASSLPGGIGVNEGATVLLLAQQGVPAAVALPIAVLRRLITLWSLVALAAAVGVLPLSPGGLLRRDS